MDGTRLTELWRNKTKDGKTWSRDSGWASYVLEKQPEGARKIAQYHFSGPMALTRKTT